MIDNVKGELDDIIASSVPHDPLRAYTIEVAVNQIIAHLAERGMVVLGPDGEPLDVRPALRALGDEAWPFKWTTINGRFHSENRPGALRRLAEQGITGPLAQKCLDSASEES